MDYICIFLYDEYVFTSFANTSTSACFISSSYTMVCYCTTFVPAIVCLFIYSSKKIVK